MAENAAVCRTSLISQEQDGKELYYHFNNIGSTEAVTNSDGTIVETYQYGPYGELTSENKCGILFLYNGEYGVATDENGLYYMRARYYNSEIKRFINQDVVIGSIAESPSMNRYAYVQGNPISLADPFGLCPMVDWSLAGHAALDLLGLIPGIGVVFDIANMIWYIAEGDAFGAVCSFISALPAIGEVTGAVLAGTKLAKFSCSIVKITKTAAHVGSIAKSTYVIGNVVRNNVEKYIINGEDFDPNQFVVDVLTVGMESFAIGSSIKGLKNTSSQSWCFVAGTAVLTAEGHKAIEDIEVGDMVLAENPETGDVEYKEVLETYENETEELIHVHVNGEDIVTTPSHPFYVNQFGWTRAAQLRAGDVLVLSNGEYVVVEFIQHEILESPVKVYNLEVEDYHTYFVGESSVLVHNSCVHKMTGEIIDNNGNVVRSKQQFTSGSNASRRLSWQEQLETHTEAKFLKSINQQEINQSHTINMVGQKDPCRPGCQPKIRDIVYNTGAQVTYYSESNNRLYYWYRDEETRDVLQVIYNNYSTSKQSANAYRYYYSYYFNNDKDVIVNGSRQPIKRGLESW